MTTEQRLGRLERTNQRWRWMVCALVLVLIASVSMGQVRKPRAGAVVATSFELVNSRGKRLLTLDSLGDQALMKFYDEEGKVVASLPHSFQALNDDAGDFRLNRDYSFVLRDSTGKMRIALGTPGGNEKLDMGSHLLLFDRTTSNPRIELSEQHGIARFALLTDVLRDEGGMTFRSVARAGLRADPQNSILSLFDANWKTHVSLHVTAGKSSLALSDADGRTRAKLGVGPEGPYLVFYDENQKVIERLP